MNKIILLFTAFFVMLISACSSDNDEEEDNPNIPQVVTGEPIDGVRIAWNYSTIEQLAPTGGYPRLHRLQDNSIVVVAEDYRSNSILIRSYDEGKTWTEPFKIFPSITINNDRGSVQVNMSNPEITQLPNGDILAACNFRPVAFEIAPFSIAIRKSSDNGKTWSPVRTVFDAQPRFDDGCWEPSFLRLPNGELQIYFANESKYTSSNEQEISMLSSNDNGDTWSQPKTVCFRAGRRDGMPIGRIINDEIVVTIEDNKIGQFKPYTVRTKISDNWSQPVLADSPYRDYCLTNKVNDNVYMGAPYLLVLPGGETFLSYQSNENRNNNWELSTMEVAIGNKEAKKFDRRTRPFPVTLSQQATWNSIAMWDAKTVVALTSSDMNGGSIAPFLIKGYILSDIEITKKEITEFPIFVGAETDAHMQMGLGIDASNLYIKCKVNDLTPVKAPDGTQRGDGIYICIDTENASLKEPDKGIYKLWCSSDGKIIMSEGEAGKWKTIPSSNINTVGTSSSNGYDLDIVIPRNSIHELGNTIRIGAGISNYKNQYTGTTEFLVHGNEKAPHTWMKVKL